MPISVETAPSKRSGTAVDYMTTWLHTPIKKSHAMLPAVRDIVRRQRYNDMTTVSIIGREGTGKTNLASVLSHYLHIEMAKMSARQDIVLDQEHLDMRRPYGVFWFRAKDFLNFQSTLDSLPKVNRIIIFDDVTFLAGAAGKPAIEKIKQQMIRIRHGENNQDYRVILFHIFHYSRGIDRWIRDTDFKFLTSVGSEEVGNYQDLLGREHTDILRDFKKKNPAFVRGEPLNVSCGPPPNRRVLKYIYNKPFRVALYYNSDVLRWMVYPKFTTAIPRGCATCQHPGATAVVRKMDPEQHLKIHAFVSEYCGETIANQAARLVGFARYGRPLYVDGTRLRRAIEILRRLERDAMFSIDDYLADIMPDKIPRDENGRIKNTKSTYVSEDIRRDFEAKFRVDALRPMSD